MFELISQIPFHFTTSLCPLMDPIYYIYHKLYRIFADHVGQSPGRGWWNGTAAFFTCSSSQCTFTVLRRKSKCRAQTWAGGRDKGSQNWCWCLINLARWRDMMAAAPLLRIKTTYEHGWKYVWGKHTRQHSWRRAIWLRKWSTQPWKGNLTCVKTDSVFLQNEHINTTCLFEHWQRERTFKRHFELWFCKITRIRDGECFNMATLNPHLV